MIHTNSIAFAWKMHEFEMKEKTRSWYWVLGGVSVLFIIGAILLHNYLFALLVLIASFLIVLFSKKEPLLLDVEVSERGIKFHDELFSYAQIESFWIKEGMQGEAVLIIKTGKKITPLLVLTIDPEIPVLELRDYLLHFIDEEELREPLTDRLIEKIGF